MHLQGFKLFFALSFGAFPATQKLAAHVLSSMVNHSQIYGLVLGGWGEMTSHPWPLFGHSAKPIFLIKFDVLAF